MCVCMRNLNQATNGRTRIERRINYFIYVAYDNISMKSETAIDRLIASFQ